MTKPTQWLIPPAKTWISLAIRPVWSESSQSAQWLADDPMFLHADSEEWSDWADAQADLSLRWVHSFQKVHSEDWSNCGCAGSSVFVGHSWLCGFCFDLAHVFSVILMIFWPSQHYYIYIEPFLWRAWEGMLNRLNEFKEKRRKKILINNFKLQINIDN